MVFNSFNFWLIFPFIFVMYWAIPAKYLWARNGFLLIVSYLLYMNWKPAFAFALLGVTVVTFLGGVIVSGSNSSPSTSSGPGSNSSKRKTLCWCFAILGLLPLLIFKYYNFLNDSLTAGLEMCGLHFALPGLNWAIPVGISFFTFQAVGYLLDVYHGRIKAEMNLLDYALFVSFFPQVTSGPISTAKDLIPQFKTAHSFRYEQGVEGLRMLLWGMFLKCVVADRLGLYVDTVYANYIHFSGLNCFLASVFYTIQIYGDFAGYSLMAIGIAKTLGFDLINNFNRPYFATSITEFWKRWHISLTRWLTTHVYINLGGNRCSKVRQYLNIMLTFLVSGLWHGANWTFVIWGAIHGVLQVVEKVLGLDPKGKLNANLQTSPNIQTIVIPIRIVVTFLLVSFAWIFFRMPTLADAWGVISQIFTDHTAQAILDKAKNKDILFMTIGILSLLLVELRQEYLANKLRWLDSRWCKWVLYVIAFCMILCMGVLDAGSFIYVSF